LAAEWIESLQHGSQNKKKIYVTWLSLDKADNDLYRFLIYFFAAITQMEG
jgi:ATP/maltotriose-dependent transcriptional regulator MalT